MSDAIRNLQVALSLDTSKFTSSVKTVNQHIKDLDVKFKNASLQTKNFENSFTGLSTKMDYLKGKISATQEKVKLLTQEQKDNTDKLNLAKQAYESAKTTWQESAKKLDELKSSGKATTEEIAKQEQEVQKNYKAMLVAEKGYQKLVDKNASLDRQLENSKTALKNMKVALEETTQKFNALENKTETTDDKLKKLNSSVPLLESKMKLLTSTLGSNAKASQKLKVEQINLQAKFELTGQKANLLGTKVKELETKQKALNSAMKLTKASIDSVEQELAQAKAKYGENSKEVIKLQTKLLSLKDTYLKLNGSLDSTENELNQFQTELNETQAELNQTEDGLKNVATKLKTLPFEQAASKMTTFGQNLQNIGRSLKSAGMMMTTRLTLPIVGFGAASIKATMDFEAQMSTVQAISGLTGDSLDRLTEKAREMGASTTFSATEAGQAMEYMALAGWKEKEMLEGIEPILRLAEAGKMDLAKASDLVTDSMGGMGIEIEELLPYLDKVAATSSNANTSVEQLLAAFINVGPTATRLNISLQETSAVLGILANNGLKGEAAGTKLNAMLTRMTAQSGPAKKAWDKIGVSIFDSTGKFRGLTTILSETQEKFDKLNDKDQAEFLKNAVGTFNSTEFSNLLRSTNGELQELTATVKDSDNALYEMAATMQDNAAGKTKTMKSALQELQIVIGEKLMPVFVRIVEKITELANKFGELSEEEQNSIIKKALLVAAIGPLLSVLGTLTTVIGGLSKGFGLVSSGLGKLVGASSGAATAAANAGASILSSGGLIAKAAGLITNPWVLVGTAVAGGVAIAVKETKKLEEFTAESTEKTRKMVANLEKDYNNSFKSISKTIDTLTEKDIKFVSDEDKILLQKDLKDIEDIINGGAGNAEKEMSEYINRIIKYLPEMSEEMQQSTAAGIKLMIETLAKDGKFGNEAVKTAEELWNAINEKLTKPLEPLDTSSIKASLEMQDLFINFSKDLADSKGWGGYSKITGDWDQTVASLNNMIRASKDIKAEDIPGHVNSIIGAMKNSEVPAELMSYAFSKSLSSALEAFGPTGATAYFKQFVSELGLGATDVETTISNMAFAYQYLPEEQKKACDTLLSDLLTHYGYIDEMTLGFNEDMLSQSSEMWSGVVGNYLHGTDNAKTVVGAFVTDAIENIKYMSDENKEKSVEWMSTYLDKMIETGVLTVGEAQDMADKINAELDQEVVTKVGINADKFYSGYMKAKGDVETLDVSEAEPSFLANVEKFKTGNKETLDALKKTDKETATPEIKADNTDAVKKIDTVQTKIDKLPSLRTITLQVNETTTKKTVFAPPTGAVPATVALQETQEFSTRAATLFRDNLSNINDDYITSGSFYNRNTSSVSKETTNSKFEKMLIDTLKDVLKTNKEFNQNITINSAKQLSPREIAQQARLAGQQLLRLY